MDGKAINAIEFDDKRHESHPPYIKAGTSAYYVYNYTAVSILFFGILQEGSDILIITFENEIYHYDQRSIELP